MSRAALALLERPQSLPPLARVLMGLTVTVMQWELRHRSRRSLSRLDDHLLKDIGVSQTEAQAEWDKPFWWQ
jgi:uncharacterized protein YjiS (DUF1127 family)